MCARIPPCADDSLAEQHVPALCAYVAFGPQVVDSEQRAFWREYGRHEFVAVFGAPGASSYEFVECFDAGFNCVCVVLGNETCSCRGAQVRMENPAVVFGEKLIVWREAGLCCLLRLSLSRCLCLGKLCEVTGDLLR